MPPSQAKPRSQRRSAQTIDQIERVEVITTDLTATRALLTAATLGRRK